MLTYREPNIGDLERYFEWVNDPIVREQSFNSLPVTFEEHVNWFKAALADPLCSMYLFENEKKEKVGQVRIQQIDSITVIGISIVEAHRGKGYASKMLDLATENFLLSNPAAAISAFIKPTNRASRLSFEKSGFQLQEIVLYKHIKSCHYIKRHENRPL